MLMAELWCIHPWKICFIRSVLCCRCYQRAVKKGNSLGEMQTTSQEEKNADTAKIEGMKLEEALDELAKLLDRMEEGDLPLEESFHLYRQGMKLTEYCNGQLDDVEKQVKKIGADGELEPFA